MCSKCIQFEHGIKVEHGINLIIGIGTCQLNHITSIS